MRDERRNSGEYYPGGRVIARPGTAPQQVVVQWSDVQGKPQIAPLPERYKDSDVKTKINEIASKFATVLMAAFVVWTACADVTVQKKRKDEIYNDELIVVDVTGGGDGGGVQVEVDPTVPDWAKSEVEPVWSVNGQIGEVDISAADIPYDGLHDLDTVKKALDEHMAQLDSLWPALSGKANSDDVASLADDVNSALLYSRGVYNYMSGNTNAWWSGTNYVFGADAAARTRFAWSPGMDAETVPCSMALWEIRDGVRQCVWDQRDWTTWYWNYVSAKFRQEVAASNAVLSAAITNRAPRAWSGTTAATGLDNPDRSTTWVDTPTLTLAPGMAWETVAHVGGCGYWGIVGNGTVIGGSGTNATLEIRDFEGKTVMRVVKGDSRLVYLERGSDIYTSGYDSQGRVTFTMRSDTQPVGEFSTVLDTALFVGEDNANCPVDYEWETVTPGAVYRCHFLVKSGIDADSCFARFKAMRNENTRIEYAADQVISGGLIYGGVKIAPVIPANAAVGDTITWKVIAK